MGQPQRPIGAEQHIISLGRVLQSLREEDNIDVLIQTIITFVKEQFDYNLLSRLPALKRRGFGLNRRAIANPTFT
ncbi:hypothetical protein CAL7716_038600 [Calothrix sp. PCC 7716]|nr:hypothetical protein CAL7716_038600 [Calothrix sp. PCC 7716]